MRYVVEMMIMCEEDRFPPVRNALREHGIEVPYADPLRIRIEKTDPRLQPIVKDLEGIGHLAHLSYHPAFEPWEIDEAELVVLRVRGFCGAAFETWAKRLSLPPDTRVKDKREMGGLDIGKTYAWKEVLISERLREILAYEGLTGWAVEPVQHRDPKKDRFPPLYQLLSTHELPSLAPETEIHVDTHENVPKDDFLYGTIALFERGPLCYRRRDLLAVEDFNRTREGFMEILVRHPYFIVSQRVRRVFQAHRIRGHVEFEPVVILE